jgi:hypothetical protein
MKTFLAMLALVGAQAAAAPPPPPACVTRAQLSDLTLFALPSVLDAAVAKCRASLRPDAYLLNGGRELSRRLAVDSQSHWEGAQAAMRQMGSRDMPEGIGADTMRGLVRDVLAAEFLKKLTPADCGRVNDVAELIAPLPPRNLGQLTALLIELGGAKKGLRVCP